MRRIKNDGSSTGGGVMQIDKCKCGGDGYIFAEIYKAEVVHYWVECIKCRRWTDTARSEPAAVQNWNDRQEGYIIRRSHHHFNIGY